jgi:hypothetical protein
MSEASIWVQKAEKVYTVTGKRDAEILIDCTY